jgi:hypothetical protein
MPVFFNFFFFFCMCVLLGFELRAYTSSHATSPLFCDEFLEIGSHELFVWDGFEPRSS